MSDNATTFKAAACVLAIKWSFNPPASPWYGGFYERLVKSVKGPLKVLGRAILTVSKLASLIIDIESLVNERPLTNVSADCQDQAPITPAMLLGQVWGNQGSSSRVNNGAVSLDTPMQNREHARKRLQHLQMVHQHLQKRWEDEYLSQLRLFHRQKVRTIEISELVYVMNGQKRQHWRLGVVVRTFPGRDGRTRVVEVKVAGNTFIRPINLLVPLEVSCTEQASLA